jgi:hypothetical protein
VFSDFLALAWPESHGFGWDLSGFDCGKYLARPEAKPKPFLALAFRESISSDLKQ